MACNADFCAAPLRDVLGLKAADIMVFVGLEEVDTRGVLGFVHRAGAIDRGPALRDRALVMDACLAWWYRAQHLLDGLDLFANLALALVADGDAARARAARVFHSQNSQSMVQGRVDLLRRLDQLATMRR